MNIYFFHAMTKEFACTWTGIREFILALADRTNRKVLTARLHWDAAHLHQEMAKASVCLGEHLVTLPRSADTPTLHVIPHDSSTKDLSQLLAESHTQMERYRQELNRIHAQIQELDADTLREDLLKFQMDLSFNRLSFQRLIAERHAPIIGTGLGSIAAEDTKRVVIGIMRGHRLLRPHDGLVIQIGDIALLLGSDTDVALAQSYFLKPEKALPVAL